MVNGDFWEGNGDWDDGLKFRYVLIDRYKDYVCLVGVGREVGGRVCKS